MVGVSRMDLTFIAVLKRATRVRLIRCVVVPVCVVVVGFLLTCAVLLSESFPDVVSVGKGEEKPIEVPERGSSRKLEADAGKYSPVRKGHGLGQVGESSGGVEFLAGSPVVRVRDVRREVEMDHAVRVRNEAEASVKRDSEEGGRYGDGDGIKQVMGHGIPQSADTELVRQGLQPGLAAAPTVVAVGPRGATRGELRITPVSRPIGGKGGGSLASVAPTVAAIKKGTLAPDVQLQSDLSEAGEESHSESGDQSEDEAGDEVEEDLDYFQQAIRNGTVMRVNHSVWDTRVGCRNFSRKHSRSTSRSRSIQDSKVDNCPMLRKQHVSVLVKEWTWIPDTLNNLYSCECGLTCLWTNSEVLQAKPDVHLYETTHPPYGKRQKGQPWRVYLDLEPGRNRASSQDLFVSYHAKDDIQVTYAGASFHVIRNYYISPLKHKEVLVYWSSSRCLNKRQRTASELLKYLPHHSFGKCLNNVGGLDMILHMYPSCKSGSGAGNSWSQNLHCAMSHYKFVLAIENTITESYVTEKLFYALDAGSVPIYFGAPNVLDFVPPNSIIDGSKFASMQKLAEYVKKVGADPVLYAEFHAWRRCGVMGPYGRTRAVSLDSLPCRLCAAVSKLGGRDA